MAFGGIENFERLMSQLHVLKVDTGVFAITGSACLKGGRAFSEKGTAKGECRSMGLRATAMAQG